MKLGIQDFNKPKTSGSSQRTTKMQRMVIVKNHNGYHNTLQQHTFKSVAQNKLLD